MKKRWTLVHLTLNIVCFDTFWRRQKTGYICKNLKTHSSIFKGHFWYWCTIFSKHCVTFEKCYKNMVYYYSLEKIQHVFILLKFSGLFVAHIEQILSKTLWKRTEDNLHTHGETASVNSISKDRPQGFLLLHRKQALSRNLFFKKTYWSMTSLPVASLWLKHTHKHTRTHVNANLLGTDTLTTCKALAAGSQCWHFVAGANILDNVLLTRRISPLLSAPQVRRGKLYTEAHTQTHTKGQSILGDILQTVSGNWV